MNKNCDNRKPSRLEYYKAVVDAIPVGGIAFREDFDTLLACVAIDMKVEKPGAAGAVEVLDLMDLIATWRRSEDKHKTSRFVDGDMIYRKAPLPTISIRPGQVDVLMMVCRDAKSFVDRHANNTMIMETGKYTLRCDKTSVTITLGE